MILFVSIYIPDFTDFKITQSNALGLAHLKCAKIFRIFRGLQLTKNWYFSKICF